MQYSQEHLKTMIYAEFGGQTEYIMGNWKIENGFFFWQLKNLIIVMFWRHNYFLLKVKNSQENLFKESYFKKWLFKL